MVTPELKRPMTNFTPSPANLLATETPSFGSPRSSPTKSWIFWPLMPPAALMSATACSTPFFSCRPKAALPPVIGPATPSLICAWSRTRRRYGKAERKTEHSNPFHSKNSPRMAWRAASPAEDDTGRCPPVTPISSAKAGKRSAGFGCCGVSRSPFSHPVGVDRPAGRSSHIVPPIWLGAGHAIAPEPNKRQTQGVDGVIIGRQKGCRRPGRSGRNGQRHPSASAARTTRHDKVSARRRQWRWMVDFLERGARGLSARSRRCWGRFARRGGGLRVRGRPGRRRYGTFRVYLA